jgi:hypothetical protein
LRWPDVHDPAAWARQLCEDLAGVPEARLAVIAEQLASGQRYRMPPAADILAAVEERR